MFLAFIFGSSASPGVTSYVLKAQGGRIREEFGEEVFMIISRFFYVDDGSGGSNTIERCKKLARDLEAAMEKGGFRLAKWKYSHPQLRREGEEEQEEQQSILAISWNTKEDTLSVAVDEAKFKEEATTPRMVVKQQASLFDLIGICAPFILLVRQWTQQSMIGPWGWDIKMTTEVIEGFNKWTELIPLLKEVKIAR